MWPAAPEARQEAGDNLSLRASEETHPANALILDFWLLNCERNLPAAAT